MSDRGGKTRLTNGPDSSPPSTPPSASPRGAPNSTQATDADHAEQLVKLQAAVAGLAREVEAMRRALRQVPTTGDLARLAATVVELSETTAAMQTASGGRRAEPEAVPSWLTLPRDQHSARAVLSDLTGWLRDVYLRYPDAARDLPECWLWHPDIVEELVWLMYAWLAAYRDDDASIRAVGDWHDRLRPGVVRRIHSYAATCSLENHLPGRPRATGAPQIPVGDTEPDIDGTDAVEVIAAWWTQRRDEPGPAPTNDQMTAAAAAARKARTGSGGGAPTSGGSR
jgi:hypothetical protein